MEIRDILDNMIRLRASDLHMKAGTRPIVRVDGQIYALDLPAASSQELHEHCTRLLSDEQREHFRTHHEIDFAFGVPGLGRFRANLFMQRGTPAIAIRHVPVEIPKMTDLYLPPIIRELAFSQRGLILVTGRTGSGKSTTLAAMIDEVNHTVSKNVITIEDPIEFLHIDRMSCIHQREVGLDTATFHDGLKYVLRQDPDIILVGEIRDLETMRLALMAADTGHLVLSTLHTTDVLQTVHRILAFFPPHQHDEIRMSIASNLTAVISQRLIARADDKGRVPANEIMINNPTIREALMDNTKLNSIATLMAEGYTQYSMQTFDQSVLHLLQAGLISEAEALKNANRPNELLLKIRGILGASDRVWQPVTAGQSDGNGEDSAAEGLADAGPLAPGAFPEPKWAS